MKTFKNILLVVDLDRHTEPALSRALALTRGGGSVITISTVIEGTLQTGPASEIISETQQKLEGFAQLIDDGDIEVRTKIFMGRAFSEIILDVIKNERDLVIKPVEPRKPGYKLLAGTDFKLLRKCPCPVLLIRDIENYRFRSIVAAVDVESRNTENDQLSAEILTLASSIAVRSASDLHVVHAWEIEHENYLRTSRAGLSFPEINQLRDNECQKRGAMISSWIDAYCSEVLTTGKGTTPNVVLKNGPARTEIPAFVAEVEADLVVMGTVGRTGIPGFFIGNTAEEILNQVTCSVLALKPINFISPVAERLSRGNEQLRSVL